MKLFMPVPCCGFRGSGCAGVLLLAFWAWVLYDCYTHEPRVGKTWIAWMVVIVLGQALGAALYVFLRRPQRVARHGR